MGKEKKTTVRNMLRFFIRGIEESVARIEFTKNTMVPRIGEYVDIKDIYRPNIDEIEEEIQRPINFDHYKVVMVEYAYHGDMQWIEITLEGEYYDDRGVY